MAAGAGNLAAVPDVLMTEAVACNKALLSTTDLGISRIQIEVDSSVLKQAITSSAMDLAACGMLISDIRGLLRDQFVSDDVLLIPRNCNAVAHNLARLGMSWDPGTSCVWTNHLPEFVRCLVSHEFVETVSSILGP